MFRSSAGLVLALLLWAHPAAADEVPVLSFGLLVCHT